jgi:alanine dehydrogenase
VWSRTEATIARFIEQVGQSFPDLILEGAASPQDVFAQADIVCTLTPSREAYVDGAWFKPGQHINAVGAPPRPDHREINAAGMARASVFLDSIPMAMHDSGDLLLAIAEGAVSKDRVMPEIGDVIIGKAAGRASADDITLFNSTGLGIQDLAIGNLIVARAREKGIGKEIDLTA